MPFMELIARDISSISPCRYIHFAGFWIDDRFPVFAEFIRSPKFGGSALASAKAANMRLAAHVALSLDCLQL